MFLVDNVNCQPLRADEEPQANKAKISWCSLSAVVPSDVRYWGNSGHGGGVRVIHGNALSRRRGVAFAVAAIMVAAILAGCTHGSSSSVSSVGDSSTASAATTAATPHLRDIEVFSRTLRLSPSGPLAHPQTIRLPLTRPVPAGWAIVVATAESSQGPWSYLPATLTADRRTAIFTTAHHSIFTVIGEDLSGLLSFFKTQFLDGLSSGATASASPPACDGKNVARTGYSVESSAGPTVYWCFGMDSAGQRILRVVNDRLYPLEIQHPGLSVIEEPAIDYGALSSLSHLLSGQDSILAPGAQIGYLVNLTSGQAAGAQTTMDGFGESLFALQTGINSLLAILTRFGAGGASKSITIMNTALGDIACSDAAFAGNPGAILASCLSPKDMADYFGTAGVLLAPLAATGGLAAFFASEFQGLHDTLTGEDQYTIIVKNETTTDALGSFLGSWAAHDLGLCVGSLLPVDGPGTKLISPPCGGSSNSGWISAWGCGTYTSSGEPVCNQYYTVEFTSNPDGSITGTIAGQPIYVDESGDVVEQQPGFWQAFQPGDKFTLAHSSTGLLSVTNSNDLTGYLCNSTVSVANRPKCGA
jgi:hypothetical protein